MPQGAGAGVVEIGDVIDVAAASAVRRRAEPFGLRKGLDLGAAARSRARSRRRTARRGVESGAFRIDCTACEATIAISSQPKHSSALDSGTGRPGSLCSHDRLFHRRSRRS